MILKVIFVLHIPPFGINQSTYYAKLKRIFILFVLLMTKTVLCPMANGFIASLEQMYSR